MFCLCHSGRKYACERHSRPKLEMKLAQVMRATYGENAVEALAGALSSITTTDQLRALIAKTKEEANA